MGVPLEMARGRSDIGAGSGAGARDGERPTRASLGDSRGGTHAVHWQAPPLVSEESRCQSGRVTGAGSDVPHPMESPLSELDVDAGELEGMYGHGSRGQTPSPMHVSSLAQEASMGFMRGEGTPLSGGSGSGIGIGIGVRAGVRGTRAASFDPPVPVGAGAAKSDGDRERVDAPVAVFRPDAVPAGAAAEDGGDLRLRIPSGGRSAGMESLPPSSTPGGNTGTPLSRRTGPPRRAGNKAKAPGAGLVASHSASGSREQQPLTPMLSARQSEADGEPDGGGVHDTAVQASKGLSRPAMASEETNARSDSLDCAGPRVGKGLVAELTRVAESSNVAGPAASRVSERVSGQAGRGRSGSARPSAETGQSGLKRSGSFGSGASHGRAMSSKGFLRVLRDFRLLPVIITDVTA